MMRTLIKLSLVLALLMIFFVPVHAQDDKELTEEEKALMERLAEVLTQPENFTSYAFSAEELSISEINIELADQPRSQTIRNTQTITREGYTLVNPDGLDARTAILHLVYSDISPEGNTSFVLDGDALMVEDILYANLAYTTQTGEVPELPMGWQSFTTPDEFPLGLALMGVDSWFNEEPTVLETYADQLVDYVTTVELATETTEEGATLDVITITLEGEDLSGFFIEVVAPTPDNEAFIALISTPDLEKSWLVQVKINADGQRVYYKTILSYSAKDLDGTAFDLAEGSTVNLSNSITQSTLRSNFDADFEPIIAPIELPTPTATE